MTNFLKLFSLPTFTPTTGDYVTGTQASGPTDGKMSISALLALLGQFTTYTPTLTGVTSLGTGGATTGYYTQIGKLVFVEAWFTLGTSPSLSGTLGFSLPVTADTTFDLSESTFGLNHAWFGHSGVNMYPGVVIWSNSSTVAFRYLANTTSAGPIIASSADNVTATAPFTWVAGDWLHWSAMYKAA